MAFQLLTAVSTGPVPQDLKNQAIIVANHAIVVANEEIAKANAGSVSYLPTGSAPTTDTIQYQIYTPETQTKIMETLNPRFIKAPELLPEPIENIYHLSIGWEIADAQAVGVECWKNGQQTDPDAENKKVYATNRLTTGFNIAKSDPFLLGEEYFCKFSLQKIEEGKLTKLDVHAELVITIPKP